MDARNGSTMILTYPIPPSMSVSISSLDHFLSANTYHYVCAPRFRQSVYSAHGLVGVALMPRSLPFPSVIVFEAHRDERISYYRASRVGHHLAPAVFFAILSAFTSFKIPRCCLVLFHHFFTWRVHRADVGRDEHCARRSLAPLHPFVPLSCVLVPPPWHAYSSLLSPQHHATHYLPT
jgi:hypothetical protein